MTEFSNDLAALIAVLLLACVHVLSESVLSRLSIDARRVVLLAASGASLSYVLMHVLPKLADKQAGLMASVDPGLLGFLEHHAYLMAMIGLLAYYGLARLAEHSGRQEAPCHGAYHRAALLSTVAGHCAYSVLIGYLIVHRLRPEFFSLVLITLAMLTHFAISDHGLAHRWPKEFKRWIRWSLAVAVLVGWVLGVATEVSSDVIALWFSFLAGGMLIITIREEMPTNESGSFWAFLSGVAAYTALILVIENLPKPEF